MKYEQKSFSSGANSKLYRENWDRVFNKGLVEMEIEIDDETEAFINKYATDHSLSFNDAILGILESQIGRWEKETVLEAKVD